MQDRNAWTIDEFCHRHGICRATYYNLKKKGRGPKTMRIGSHERISDEAAAEWRRELEAESCARTAAQ
jgi:predicted DNA-binding transcriptional regulator AlpA